MNRGSASGIRGLALLVLLIACLAPWGAAQAQRQFIGSLADFADGYSTTKTIEKMTGDMA